MNEGIDILNDESILREIAKEYAELKKNIVMEKETPSVTPIDKPEIIETSNPTGESEEKVVENEPQDAPDALAADPEILAPSVPSVPRVEEEEEKVPDASACVANEDSECSEFSAKRELMKHNKQFDLIHQNLENYDEDKRWDKRGRQCPKQRWGRDEDRKLFKLIREFEKKKIISLDEIINIKDLSNVFRDPGLMSLAKAYKWKSLIRNLGKVISSINLKTFSYFQTNF